MVVCSLETPQHLYLFQALPFDFRNEVPEEHGGNQTDENYTVTFETLPLASGSFVAGRPNTQDDSALVPFAVRENAFVIYVNLTGDGSIRPDLDLYVQDPSGKVQGSAASPEASENAVVDEKGCKRGGAGTWNAQVDPYTGLNLQYSVAITIGYKVYENASCEDGVCYE